MGGKAGPAGDWAVTRLHNAMVLIEIGDARILTDPWFTSSRAFRGRSPIGVDGLGPLTAIVGSHWARDHWQIEALAVRYGGDVPVFTSDASMVDAAVDAGFEHAEVLPWGASTALSEAVSLEAIEEHEHRGKRTSNYGFSSGATRLFYGGEVRDLGVLERYAAAHAPFEVAIGPVNGVRLLGRQLTATGPEMVEAARTLGATVLIPIHDEHRQLWPLLRVTSSVRSLDEVDHGDVTVLELALGERHAVGDPGG